MLYTEKIIKSGYGSWYISPSILLTCPSKPIKPTHYFPIHLYSFHMLSLTHLFFWNAELLNSYSFFKVHMLFFPGSLSSSSSSPDRSPPCHLPAWPSHHVACVFRSSPTTGLSMCYRVDDGYLEGKPPDLVYLASLRHWYILKYSAF